VFALKLNRREFAENPNRSIRCKFSIDGDLNGSAGAATISKPYRLRAGNPVFTIYIE
jgi:hypothetical protein